MVYQRNLIIAVLLKFARGEILNQTEQRLLEKWLVKTGEKRPLADLVTDRQWLWKNLRKLRASPGPGVWKTIKKRAAEKGRPMPVLVAHPRRLAGWVAVGGLCLSVFILVLSGKYRFSGARVPMLSAFSKDGAMVTRNDGIVVKPDSVAADSVVLKEQGVVIRKLRGNAVRYEWAAWMSTNIRSRQSFSGNAEVPINAARTIIHSFSTGKEGYKIEFPNGNYVYLDKHSTFRYTIPFRGNGGMAELDGGARFELAKNSGLPFAVRAKGTIVEVLGTIFHLRGYKTDSVTEVKLLQGSIRVSHGSQSMVLKDSGEVFVKNDLMLPGNVPFQFENTSFDEAIRQIAAWYKVEVYNPDNIEGIPITGNLPRNLTLDVLLVRIGEVENGTVQLKRNADTIVITGDAHR